MLTCDSERIVVALPPSYFATSQSDQLANGDFRTEKDYNTNTPR